MNTLKLHRVFIDYPSMIIVKAGQKTVTIGSKKLIVKAGEAIALSVGTICDVENRTDDGKFESTWIVFPENIISKVQDTSSKPLNHAIVLKNFGYEFSEAFERGVDSIKNRSIPSQVAEIRMQELLVWLSQLHVYYGSVKSNNLVHQLRLLISSNPASAWTSKEVALTMGMSEATFRRKLSLLGESFNEILIDIRMGTALTLLQVTDLPISEIGYQVGYESASRFAVRFKKRFGFSPKEIRK